MDDKLHDAFISYSSRDKSRVLRLQRELEAISHIANRPWQAFLDHTDMAARGIWPELHAALDHSRVFILCATPAAAKSAYVAEELRHFRSVHPDRDVLIALIDGDESCIPDELAGIRYADLRRALSPWPMPGKRDELLRLAAGLFAVPLRSLIPWAARRRRKLAVQVAAAAGLPLAVALGAYVVQRGQLQASEAQALVDEAFDIQDQGVDPGEALDRLYEAKQRAPDARLDHALRYLNSKLRPLDWADGGDAFISATEGTFKLGAGSAAPIRVASFPARMVLDLGESGWLAVSERGELAYGSRAGQAPQEGVLADYSNTAAITELPVACALADGWIRVSLPTGFGEELAWADTRNVRLVLQPPRPELKDEACGQEWTAWSPVRSLSDSWVETFEWEDPADGRAAVEGWRTAQSAWEAWRDADALRDPRLAMLAEVRLVPVPSGGAAADAQTLRQRLVGDAEVIRLNCGPSSLVGLLLPLSDQFRLEAGLDTQPAPAENRLVAVGTARLGSPAVVAPNCSHLFDLVNHSIVSSRRDGARQTLRSTRIEGHARQLAFAPGSRHLVVVSADGIARTFRAADDGLDWKPLRQVRTGPPLALAAASLAEFGGGVPFWDSFQTPVWFGHLGHVGIGDDGTLLWLDHAGRLNRNPGDGPAWRTPAAALSAGEHSLGLVEAGDYVYLWVGITVKVYSRDSGLLLDRLPMCACPPDAEPGECRLLAAGRRVMTQCRDETVVRRVIAGLLPLPSATDVRTKVWTRRLSSTH